MLDQIILSLLATTTPVCQYEDGSEMLYTNQYDLCVWNPIAPSQSQLNIITYYVRIDRSTQTDTKAHLTYIYTKNHQTKITKVESEWMEK